MSNNTINMEKIVDNMIEFINMFEYEGGEYNPTYTGVEAIYDEFYENKKGLINLLSNHPCYNGNGQIVLSDTSYDREIDKNIIWDFYWNYPMDIKLFDTKLSEQDAREVNFRYPEVKARAGQKASKVVRKMANVHGYNGREFEQAYAKFADAINPLKITRYTVISVNPVDFLGMSWGNSWKSCHTLDKTNKYSGGNGYSGCYSAGTLSYMLDHTSFVVYTISSDYKGDRWEFQRKIQRNMFHFGNCKLIQGRVYPQSNDCGGEEIYTQFRSIVQRVFSECLGVPNLWYNRKGTEVCRDVTREIGVHYQDLRNFDTCNVSFYGRKADTELRQWDNEKINIGHNPICPHCGSEHNNEDNILCKECENTEFGYCDHCGSLIDNSFYITDTEGNIYCDAECANNAGVYYIENTDEWCDVDRSFIYLDDLTGDYFNIDVSGFTIGEYAFECEGHAFDYGFRKDKNGDWYDEDEVYFCDECGHYVHYSDWDDDLDMCCECAEVVRESEREEAV